MNTEVSELSDWHLYEHWDRRLDAASTTSRNVPVEITDEYNNEDDAEDDPEHGYRVWGIAESDCLLQVTIGQMILTNNCEQTPFHSIKHSIKSMGHLLPHRRRLPRVVLFSAEEHPAINSHGLGKVRSIVLSSSYCEDISKLSPSTKI